MVTFDNHFTVIFVKPKFSKVYFSTLCRVRRTRVGFRRNN